MTLVIGTDEAGYGPNLGPLVVAASAWRLEAGPGDVERILAEAVAAGGRPWRDSKQVYRGGEGFSALEMGVLAAIALVTGAVPSAWPELDAVLAGGAGTVDEPPERPLLAAISLPRESPAAEPLARAAEVGFRLGRAGVALVAVRCQVIHPAEFNRFLDAGGNKSDLLSQATLRLAATLRSPDEPTVIWCDRHGGRKRYAPVLASHLACPLVRVVEETASRSVYMLPEADCRVEFSVGGESRTPVALASMTAKYVRELAMRSFNDFWCGREPGLAPTAGYPVDALRWRREAEAAVAREGVAWERIWRRA